MCNVCNGPSNADWDKAHPGKCYGCEMASRVSDEYNRRLRERREEAKKGYCEYCGGRLQPIGLSRANGKTHPDWGTRRYHKKCWVLL